jgi:ribosomal protein S18 acetylase RimI-like enzyme
MAWTLTRSLPEFLDVAGTFLRTEPVRNTVMLTILESLRQRGPAVYSDTPPVFGWHTDAARLTDGAFLQTPPHPVLLATLPEGSVPDLIRLLMGSTSPLAAVNLAGPDEGSFSAAWADATAGGTVIARTRSRLFWLAGLVPPDPAPPGSARLATDADLGLLVSWHSAFAAEAEALAIDPERTVRDRMSYGGIMLWEADAEPVAMAALSREVAGVTRVVTVYTPPRFRRRGFGGAITTAASQAALDAGAAQVVLYTDVSNPTSNALYQRLGYRPVEDRVLLDLQTGSGTRP